MQKVIYFFCVPHVLDKSGNGRHKVFKETLLTVRFSNREPETASIQKRAREIIGGKIKVSPRLVILARWARVYKLIDASYKEEITIHL